MTNQDYIEKYKNENLIITQYSDKGVILDGIINPLEIDRRDICSPTDDQGTKPHCAGYTMAQYFEALHWKRTGKPIQIEASQIYALAKTMDGNINSNGTNLESVMRAGMQLTGIKNADIRTFGNDGSSKTIDYVKHLLHKYDILLSGFAITQGWYKCTNQDFKIRHTNVGLGGHAVILCGYSDVYGGFYIQNQWGKNWGACGFALIPYDVFLKEFIYCGYLTNMYDNFD